MTQAELGDPLVTKGFISQVEKGVSAASLETLFHIAGRLEMRPTQLLALGDPEHVVMTAMDMAEAALMLEGSEAGSEWIAKLPHLLDEADTPVSALIEEIIATSPSAAGRFLRYRGLEALKEDRPDTAVELLEPSPAMVTRADAVVSRFWLGEAYRRAGRLREAMLAWEQLLASAAGPVLRTATLGHLAALYELMGDVVEAQRLRGQLPSCGASELVEPVPGCHAARSEWLWMMARSAFDRGDLAAASAYARPIPLLLSDPLPGEER